MPSSPPLLRDSNHDFGGELHDHAVHFIHAARQAFRHTPSLATFIRDLRGIERDRFVHLWNGVAALAGGHHDEAAAVNEALIRGMPDEEDGSGVLVVRCFAEALLGRIRKINASGGNLYLDARPPGAQLRAFELLRLRTPLIPFAYAAGNRALLDAIDEPCDVTLIDVGIGRGGQVRALLRNPSARRLFKSVLVIGIEPDSHSASGSGALEMAAENVLRTGAEIGVPTTFHSIPKLAEDLTVEDIAGASPRGVLLANCAFSLHHVRVAAEGATRDPDEPRAAAVGAATVAGDGRPGGANDEEERGPSSQAATSRRTVLDTLRVAGAEAIVLVEPDSNHFEEDLRVRFLYAYRHYSTLVHCLHAMLARADAHLVWTEFFAPEVRNVIAHDGQQRVERHEEMGRWVEHLEAAGFALDTLRDVVPQSAAPPGFTVRNSGHGFALCFADVSLLGVLRARPARNGPRSRRVAVRQT